MTTDGTRDQGREFGRSILRMCNVVGSRGEDSRGYEGSVGLLSGFSSNGSVSAYLVLAPGSK